MCLPRVAVIVIVLSRDDVAVGPLKYINVGDKFTMVARLPQQVFLLFVLVAGPTTGISTYGSKPSESTKPSHPATIDERESFVVRATAVPTDQTKNPFSRNSNNDLSNGDDPTKMPTSDIETDDANVVGNIEIVGNDVLSNAAQSKDFHDNFVVHEFERRLPNSLTKLNDQRATSTANVETSKQKVRPEIRKTPFANVRETTEERRSLRNPGTAVSVLLSTADSATSFGTSSTSSSLTSSEEVATAFVESDFPSYVTQLRTTDDDRPRYVSPTISTISDVSDDERTKNRIVLTMNNEFARVRSKNAKTRSNEIVTSSFELQSLGDDVESTEKWLTIESSTRNPTRIRENRVGPTTRRSRSDARGMTRYPESFGNAATIVETTVTSAVGFGFSKRYMRDAADDNHCEKFEIGDPVKREFTSPNYPDNYPPLTDCVLVLEAEKGMLLKLDFRERFELETRTTDGECRFDYLEVRDGQYGFSPRIGTYCDKAFPPEIVSQSRHLWLNFHSDDTIEYQGFKAVWTTVPRPSIDTIPPEQDPCIYYEDIPADFELRSDMIKDAKKAAEASRVALDCLWVMKTGPSMKMQLTFDSFKLEKPNDCSANFLDIFDGKTDEPSRVKKFCGSIAEALSTKSDTMYVRLYLEQKAINSSFSALITAVRDKDGNQACKADEYDCDDATCIASVLKCNNRRNCRFQRDEDEILCGTSMENQDRSRIVIILVIFSLIMCGLCSAFLFNCVRKLKRDHRIIREHIRQSREDRLDELGRRATPCPITVSRTDLRDGGSESPAGEEVDSSKELIPPTAMNVRDYTKELTMEMKYGNRVINDIHQSNNVSNATQERLQESIEEPDMCDSSCQTRESLFAPVIPDAIPSSPGFTSFGYRKNSTIDNENSRRESSGDSNYRNQQHHYHHHHQHHHRHDVNNRVHPSSLRQTPQSSQDVEPEDSQISERYPGHRCSIEDNGQICPKHNPIPAPPGWSFHETSYPQVVTEISGCRADVDNSSYRRYNSPKPERTICPNAHRHQHQHQHQHQQQQHYQNAPFARQNTVGSGERYGSFIYGSGRASTNTASSNATTTPTTTTTTSNKTVSTGSQSMCPKNREIDPRYRAEAVIEVDQKRPFSIESTKSAPDVIATH